MPRFTPHAPFFSRPPLRYACAWCAHRTRKATTDKVCLITPHDLTDGILNPQLPQGVISNLPPQQLLQAGDVLLAAHEGGYLPVVLSAPVA